MKQLLKCAAVAGFAAILVACGDKPWQTKDITGLMPPLAFELTDENSETVTAEDYHGRVVLLFFGFTHCPDVCPTTLSRLAAVTNELGDDAEDLRILFVSVDPERDTVEILRNYTDAFGPEFIGLREERATIDALTKRNRVTYGYGDKDASGNYDVSHSSAVFAFDRKGKVRLLFRESDPMASIVSDLRRLLLEDR